MIGKYLFTTPISGECGGYHIVEGFKKITSSKALNGENFTPPESLGKGKCTRFISNDSYDIYSYELQLAKKVLLSAGTEGPLYTLQFCMESNMEWREKESGAQLELQSGQGAFSFITNIFETCEYQADEHYKAFRVNFSNSKIKHIAEEFWAKIDGFSQKKMNFSMSRFKTPLACKIAIEQILHCHYNGSIKLLYVESKVQELLAHCIGILQNKLKNDALSLTKNDIENLKKAKEIVDNHISNPITLAKLSRMVYLNEYKLKNGFKVLFGKPVYAYLLDKRMEYALVLLEKRTFRVYEVADMVGYSDSSSFSKAFFKRYGYRPFDCIN